MAKVKNLPATAVEVVIVGAGPYGLSIAAHLKAQNVTFRIFGRPMHAWIDQMPQGMKLKSDGFASSLSDPESAFSLKDYCKERGIPYGDTGLPVPIGVFSAYGLEFQKRYVPEVENKVITAVRKSSTGFQVELEDGEIIEARQVVVAVGISYFKQLPAVLAKLPRELVSHSSENSNLERYEGKRVAVVGAGASALDLAGLLHQSGATVELIARKPTIRFHDPPAPRSLWRRMRAPKTGLGPGWKVFWCVNAPLAFRRMPEKFRIETVRRVLSPAPGWFIKQDVVGKVPMNLGTEIASAEQQDGRVQLELTSSDGSRRTWIADHVIAATGYKVDLRRFTFIDGDLLSGIRSVDYVPVLSSKFETSVRGLYFVGATAANSMGPLMCFVFGTQFAARRLSKHIARSARRYPERKQGAIKARALDHSSQQLSR